jgi:hypothetical protein
MAYSVLLLPDDCYGESGLHNKQEKRSLHYSKQEELHHIQTDFGFFSRTEMSQEMTKSSQDLALFLRHLKTLIAYMYFSARPRGAFSPLHTTVSVTKTGP